MCSYIYSLIVFKYVVLILRKDKYILGRIGLYFWGFGETLNYFRDLGKRRQILLGRRGHYLQGDQCIIFRDQGSTDPPPWGGAHTLHIHNFYSFRDMTRTCF